MCYMKMRFLVVSLVFAFLLRNVNGRPSHVNNNNSETNENEYEDESAVAADDSYRDEDTRVKDREQPIEEEGLERSPQSYNGNNYQEVNSDSERSVQRNADFSDYEPSKNSDDKIYDDSMNANEDVRSVPKHSRANKYIENNDANEQQENAQHLTNRDVKNYKSKRVQNNADNKRTAGEINTAPNEEGELLFNNNEDQISKRDNSKYNNIEEVSSGKQTHYDKQYQNTMQSKGTMDGKKYKYSDLNLDRDRRDIRVSNENSVDLTSSDTKAELEKSGNEDEEAAIKRHIKKLSGEELEELLNSLTEEKRALLKKIIDDNNIDDADKDGINKREITKKAGAVEENNYIESGQPDISKIQGDSSSVDANTESSVSLYNETTETNKQTDSSETSDMATSKSADSNTSSENRAELTGHTAETDQGKSDRLILCSGTDAKNQAEVNSIVQATTKNENKREVRVDDYSDMSYDDTNRNNDELNINDLSSDQAYCSQDEDLSQLVEDEVQLHDNGQNYKREVLTEKLNQHDLAESMKSLEDSFPNSNAFHDSMAYSGNLVRVKRKDSGQIVKKRAAAILPDAKVGYFPYKAENEDDDSDEGNEFDDEGFYDRTSNFAKCNPVGDDSANNLESSHEYQREFQSNSIGKSRNDNIDRDSSLGSDTDSVISGVEGIDDNLMYNSGSRSRRHVDSSSDTGDVDLKSSIPSASVSKTELKTLEEHNMNAPNYQENDAFGPLPRNYEGDSGRYKRIRRLKQSHNSEETPNSNAS